MNSIDVEVWPKYPEGDLPIRFEGVQYISLVNGETYGIPALIAEERVKNEGLPVKILYVNPENVSVVQAVRNA